MIRALAVHFIGFYAISSLMPPWVESADADLLSIWYAIFAMVDVIAWMLLGRAPSSILQKIAAYSLIVSGAWSGALAIEMIMLQDTLQQADISMQRYFDSVLGVTMICAVVMAHLPGRRAKYPAQR